MTDRIDHSSIFIELDALLDTRISVLASMGDDVLKAALLSGYHDRDIDRFLTIDNELFSKLYADRDKTILKDSIVTPMSVLLKEFAEETLDMVSNSPHHYKPKVILNIYPYDLNEEDVNELISTIVQLTYKLCDVEAVNMPYEMITPMYVKSTLSVMVLYEYYKWLEVHSLNSLLKKTTCPEVTLLGPRIYFKPKDHHVNTTIDPFEAMELLAAPLIGLKLIPIENYSLVIKKA
jgi:hypothetical protein